MKINGNLTFNADATGELRNVYVHRLTTAARDALSLGVQHKGQLIWNTDDEKYQYWDGAEWRSVANETFTVQVKLELDAKDSVRLATNDVLPAYTASGAGLGKTLTGNVNAALTIDSTAVALDNRILVKNEGGSLGVSGTHVDNGLYTATNPGNNGVAEETTITTVADVGQSLAGTYFLIDSPTTPYYVWYFVSGAGSDPTVAGKTGIMVSITTGDTAVTVASATQLVLDAHPDFSVPVSGTNTIVVTNAAVGSVTDAADNNTGFTIGTTVQGVNSEAWVLTRSVDADADDEVTSNLFTFVEEGTVAAGTGWVLTTADPITVDTTALHFALFTGFGTFTSAIAGDMLVHNGTAFANQPIEFVYNSFAAFAEAEVTDVTTVADIAGSLAGTYFTINAPGTNYYVWYNFLAAPDPAPGGTGIPVVINTNDTADAVALATQLAVNALGDFSATVLTNVVTITNTTTGSVTDATAGTSGFSINVTNQGVTSANTSHTVTHNLGQKYVNVTVLDGTDTVVQPLSIDYTDANSLSVTFSVPTDCTVVATGVSGIGLN